ncbi:MAG: YqgE/AlgH family protein [Parvularculaceae bacterium]
MSASPSDESNGADGSARDFLSGQLLIAMPNMLDPRFTRAVVLVCAHDADHAMGVVVNKPLGDVELSELFEQLEIDPREGAGGEPVYFGGPMQTERGLVLHTLDYRMETTIAVGSNIGVTATRDILVDLGGREPNRAGPERYLLAIGHAGWGEGQLEQEIAMNAWAHCDADEMIVFDGDKDATWRKALSRIGVTSSAMLSPEWASIRNDDAPLN